MKASKQILVTGGGGYKGVLLVEALLEQGHHVTLLDNFMYGYSPVLHLLKYQRLKVLKHDIRLEEYSYLSQYDVVFHLAGISGYPACEANPNSAKLINVDATRSLCRHLSKSQYLIYASTTSFYGRSGAVCSEDSDVAPVSVYGVTKHQAETIVMEREKSIALRFATVFGVSPKMRPDLLVNDFAYKAVTERSLVLFESVTKRTFIHIQDAVAAYLHSLNCLDTMAGKIFNVGSNSMNFTKMEIAQAISRHVNCTIIDSEMKDFDTRNFTIEYGRISQTGYRLTRTLDDGVRELLRLYSFYRVYSPFSII